MLPYKHARHGEILVTAHVHSLIEKDRRESCPQRTPEWYKKRENHLTASAIATACNGNPYETRATLIKRKTGREKAFVGNVATAHGNLYEQTAIEKYEKMSGEKVIEFGLLESLNPGEEFIAGSPDGITASGRAIEVKCPFRRKPTDKVPDHYMYQLQTIMHILRLPVCDFVQFVPGSFWSEETFIVTVVKYDKYFWHACFPKISRVWQEILEVRELQKKGVFVDSDEEDGSDSSEGEGTAAQYAVPEGVTLVVKKEVPLLVDINVPAPVAPPVENTSWQALSLFFEEAVNSPPKPRTRGVTQELQITL